MLLLRFTLAYMHLVLPSHFFIVVYAFCTVIQFSWVRPMRRTPFYELFAFDEIVNMNHKPTNKPSSTEQSFGTRITTMVFYVKKRNSSMLYTKKCSWFCFSWKTNEYFSVVLPFFLHFSLRFFKKRNWLFRSAHYSFQMMMIWNDSFSHEIEIDAIWLRLIQWS